VSWNPSQTIDHRIPKADVRMNTAIRPLPQGLGAGFAESMPAQNSKHIELMRLLDSQVDEHLAWSSDEPPAPSKSDTAAADLPAPPVPGEEPNAQPGEWADTVFDPSSAIDVAFTEPVVTLAGKAAARPGAGAAWQFMQASVPWLMLLFASIPITVWLTLEWSDSSLPAAAVAAEKPPAEPATKPAQTPTLAALPAKPAPAQAAASPVPAVAAAQSSLAAAPADVPAPDPRPTDTAACAESRAALGLCSTQPGPSTTRSGVKP
jgi:hypothetical protein